MDNWTPEYRLKLIDILSRWISYANRIDQRDKVEDHAQRIYFLATADSDFLERNRANYADVIEKLRAETD